VPKVIQTEQYWFQVLIIIFFLFGKKKRKEKLEDRIKAKIKQQR
jgi:hypothetical protein